MDLAVVLLGEVDQGLAIRVNQKLEYDCVAGKLTNLANSDHLLTKRKDAGS